MDGPLGQESNQAISQASCRRSKPMALPKIGLVRNPCIVIEPGTPEALLLVKYKSREPIPVQDINVTVYLLYSPAGSVEART